MKWLNWNEYVFWNGWIETNMIDLILILIYIDSDYFRTLCMQRYSRHQWVSEQEPLNPISTKCYKTHFASWNSWFCAKTIFILKNYCLRWTKKIVYLVKHWFFVWLEYYLGFSFRLFKNFKTLYRPQFWLSDVLNTRIVFYAKT